ncbi:hypothetical protein AALO_G00190700 [Alosa alosa]|uniref:separase n=1 Tax=Alosa alosa TaxID=278164 RepID=A0AAV6G9X4_9TELE|nr:separin [Alosa alosa]KAG5270267.1 hypothetical protein AALO_G00190700 [Alosa alosa]
MRCVKTEDFVRRISTSADAAALHNELEGFLGSGGGPHTRAVCDRIIHACYQRLGLGAQLEVGLVQSVMRLVQLAVGGYKQVEEVRPSAPLYLEKMLFHILQKLMKVGKQHCADLALLLFQRLKATDSQEEEYQALVQNCFALMWNAAGGVRESHTPEPTNTPAPTHTLRVRLEALRFRLLQESVCVLGGPSKGCVYVEEALIQYRRACGGLTHTHAVTMLRLLQECVLGPLWSVEECVSDLGPLCFLTVKVCKMLCGAELWDLANQQVAEAEGRVQGQREELCSALQLCGWSVQLHRLLRTSESDGGHTYAACAQLLSNLSVTMETHSQPILEACQLVVWATETGPRNGMEAATLLACLNFLKQHQQTILVCEAPNLQTTLCQSLCQAFSSTHTSLKKSKVLEGVCLQQVMERLQGSVTELLQHLQKLANENLLQHAVSTMNGVVFELFNRKLHLEALSLVKPLCEQLVKSRPPSLSTERVNHCFLQAVQSFRRVGDHRGALQAVSDWLLCLSKEELRDMCSITHTHSLSHTHPIKLWAKIKADAAKSGEEELLLRTLRDSFQGAEPGDAVMMQLLEVELRAYADGSHDLHRETYNTLCDLLDLCPEDSEHTHTRAHTLLQLAQVTCLHDFSQLTDCSPVDFAHEALRLLEVEPETVANADWLRDDTAHASLWLYICQSEKSLQEAMSTEKRLREEQDRGGVACLEPLLPNDLDQEERERVKESVLVYEGLNFNLKQHTDRLAALNKSLSLWAGLVVEGAVPVVRHPAHTASSLLLLASLYTLMSKPLEALQSYQLAHRLSCCLGDAQSSASALCHCARVLMDLGEWESAQVHLEQAEECITKAAASSSITIISMTIKLLRASIFYCTGEVDRGVCVLCEVLCDVEKKHSRSFYMLKAQALQTASTYLSLDTHSLPSELRSKITQHGLISPDVAQYEGMKLLHSLVVMLLGKGLFGASSSNSDSNSTAQDNTGDGLLIKYQLLSEVCVCARRLVCVRSKAGSAHEAKVQCLEALKLASKLQSINHCADLLVCKAELELLKGASEESAQDLQRVKNLLESCTDSSGGRGSDMKLNLRKVLTPMDLQAPPPQRQEEEHNDDTDGLLSSRQIPRIVVEGVGVASGQGSSPPLKQRSDWLRSLSHTAECVCAVCSDLTLGRVCVSWALASAALSSLTHTHPKTNSSTHTHSRAALRLYRLCVQRCQRLSHTLARKLQSLPLTHTHTSTPLHPLLRVPVARALVGQAESMMGRQPQLSPELQGVLEKGLKVTTPRGHAWAELLTLRAELLALRGVACCLAIAAKRQVSVEDLFSGVWSWNPPKKREHSGVCEPQEELTHTHTPRAAFQTPARGARSSQSSAPKSLLRPAPSSTPSVFKTPCAPGHRPKSAAASLSVFEFPGGSPEHSHTRARTAPITPRLHAGKKASGRGFQVFEDTSPTEVAAPKAPPAPRRTKRSRFKVVFSDESDSDSEAPPVAEVKKRSPQTSRKSRPPQKAPANQKAPPAQKAPPTQRTTRGKSALHQSATAPQEGVALTQQRPRRGRSKKDSSHCEEVETLRTIEDEEDLKGDQSLDLLQLSDTDTGDAVDGLDECEILRRDLGAEMGCGHVIDIRKAVEPLTHIHSGMDLSLDSALSILQSSWLLLQHAPPPSLFSRLSSLIAQSHGNKDPVTTAMMHSNALGITTRHHMTRLLASRMRKWRKCQPDVADALEALSLKEETHKETQKLLTLQQIFSFPTAEPRALPQTHTHQFSQQLQDLPKGVIVCMLSVVEACPGTIDTLLLTRLERDSAPITIRIPTAQRQNSVSVCVAELEAILEQQKQLNGVSEKNQWWEGRRSLDSRMQRLLEHMQECLGVWLCLLLPLASDPALSEQLAHLMPLPPSCSITTHMLQVVLSAAPLLSHSDLQSLAEGAGLDPEACLNLQKATAKLQKRVEPEGHTVLILDKYLQKLPWESIPCLRPRTVTRMPSLQAVLGHAYLQKLDAECVLVQGVDPQQVFYVLNPDGNLPDTQQRFEEWFSSEEVWQGVCGSAPDPGKLQEAMATKDLYIYVGHGAGARFLDSGRLLKGEVRSAALLFGCSSAALSVNGLQEGTGIVLNYISAGCPLVLGNLWDVTDRDIDRLTVALLRSWLSGGPGSSLLAHLPAARTNTRLTHMIGAAPVAYGLPVYLR